MWEVIVGVVLTAALGGILVPWLTGISNGRRERRTTSVDLLEKLAESLWTYWKAALRVAYYGKQGSAGGAHLAEALERWNSDEAWESGSEIQIQVSRAKRLLNKRTHADIDQMQREVVDDLDLRIENMSANASAAQWKTCYEELLTTKRQEIDDLLAQVTRDLKLTPWRRRIEGSPRLRANAPTAKPSNDSGASRVQPPRTS